MTFFRYLCILVFISTVFLSCGDDELACTSNALIYNDGKEGCADAIVKKYSPIISDGDNEFIVLEYTSNVVGRMMITLYSGQNEILETNDTARWHDGVLFEITSGEELISGSSIITDVDRDKGTVSFTFNVEIRRINNNIYTISGTITDLLFQ